MILIVFGKEHELFLTEEHSVSAAIVELYNYTKGGMDVDLFTKAVGAMAVQTSLDDIVRFFNLIALEMPIHAIYTGVQKHWSAYND